MKEINSIVENIPILISTRKKIKFSKQSLNSKIYEIKNGIALIYDDDKWKFIDIENSSILHSEMPNFPQYHGHISFGDYTVFLFSKFPVENEFLIVIFQNKQYINKFVFELIEYLFSDGQSLYCLCYEDNHGYILRKFTNILEGEFKIIELGNKISLVSIDFSDNIMCVVTKEVNTCELEMYVIEKDSFEYRVIKIHDERMNNVFYLKTALIDDYICIIITHIYSVTHFKSQNNILLISYNILENKMKSRLIENTVLVSELESPIVIDSKVFTLVEKNLKTKLIEINENLSIKSFDIENSMKKIFGKLAYEHELCSKKYNWFVSSSHTSKIYISKILSLNVVVGKYILTSNPLIRYDSENHKFITISNVIIRNNNTINQFFIRGNYSEPKICIRGYEFEEKSICIEKEIGIRSYFKIIVLDFKSQSMKELILITHDAKLECISLDERRINVGLFVEKSTYEVVSIELIKLK